MEFWNDEVTLHSWQKLVGLKKEFDFILIGGWAVYMYTKLHRSKDIDIIIDYKTLQYLSSNYMLSKNERLKKYEIKQEDFDIDVYLPKFSKLALPVEDINGELVTEIEDFKLPTAEALMILKLGAYLERNKSVKGDKDLIDMMGLLFYSKINIDRFGKLLEKYKLTDYAQTLLTALLTLDKSLLRFLNLNEKTFSELKNRYKGEIKQIL